jgi:hypothetical protein
MCDKSPEDVGCCNHTHADYISEREQNRVMLLNAAINSASGALEMSLASHHQIGSLTSKSLVEESVKTLTVLMSKLGEAFK